MNQQEISFRYPRILSIAGSDSGGGAGIQADLKTCAALGCFGMTAITAVTAQNTCGVTAIHAVPIEMLAQQIDAVASDIGVDAVKIGMLHSPDIVNIVEQAIKRYQWKNIVLDPVMTATSGDRLIAQEAISLIVEKLFPIVTLVTPNLDEAALLLGRDVQTIDQMKVAARNLMQLNAKAILLKGGHLSGDLIVDLFLSSESSEEVSGKKLTRMESARIKSRNTHGTGCTLSSAVACFLGLGYELEHAIRLAREYVFQAIAQGAHAMIGNGHGPLNHGYAPQRMKQLPANAIDTN